MELTIAQPDDFHLHLRDGALLEAVTPHSAKHFGRAIIMPNLKPPITTTSSAISYRESILKAIPKTSNFTPLMTLYLTDATTPNEIQLAKKSGFVYGVKLYPAGATTNSQDGVTDLFGNCYSVLEEMVEQGLPLLVHGEVTNPEVDIFDRAPPSSLKKEKPIAPSFHPNFSLHFLSLSLHEINHIIPTISPRFEFGSPIPHRRREPPPRAKMIAISYLTALTTYFSYGLLFAFGQFRDFFRKIILVQFE